MKSKTLTVLDRVAEQSGANEPVDAIAEPTTPVPAMMGAIWERMTMWG